MAPRTPARLGFGWFGSRSHLNLERIGKVWKRYRSDRTAKRPCLRCLWNPVSTVNRRWDPFCAGLCCLRFWELCFYMASTGWFSIIFDSHHCAQLAWFKSSTWEQLGLGREHCFVFFWREHGRWSADSAENTEAFSTSVWERDGLELQFLGRQAPGHRTAFIQWSEA